MDSLETEIKSLIISALDLEDFEVGDIKSDAPLFGGDLGLDSIDALELGIAIKKKYNIVLSAENKENKQYFYSVETLAKFVASNKEKVS